jgi:hypothetical protein
LLFIFYVYIEKNMRKKKNKDMIDDKNRKEKYFCGWPGGHFHGWLNMWLTNKKIHLDLDMWLADTPEHAGARAGG